MGWVLDGKPAVFLSCSEKFKKQVARPIRDALTPLGLHGVIVSNEPLMARVPSDPDSQVDAYLNASNAFVALCTPDNRLDDGAVVCRQNIIDEIQRAKSKPHLAHMIQVLKEPTVRLPSNINPTYDRLESTTPVRRQRQS